MNSEDQPRIEDRVRSATRARASLVRDIRPLGAPEPVRLRPGPAPRSHRWINWGIPLAAAAAVVAIALTVIAIRQPGSAPTPVSPPTPTQTTIPRYYATLDFDAKGGVYTGPLIVGDDVTGTVIATVAPPPGLIFDSVRGASDDRTFVLEAGSKAANGSAPYTLYLLRIGPGTARPYQLTKLPVKLPASSPFAFAYALSPDGRELAVESESGSRSASGWVTRLGVYSVTSGAELRAWTRTSATALSGPVQATLSWLSDGQQLAFSTIKSTAADILSLQLRTLDVSASGTGLLTASRAVLTVPLSAASTCDSLHMTPDGKTAICATQYAFLVGAGTTAGCGGGGLEITAYSVPAGKPVRVLYQYRGACDNGESFLLWTDASATAIIGATATDVANEGGKQADQVGVITDGRLRPLKIANSVSPQNYPGLAF